MPDEPDHLLRAIRADGEPAGSYDLRGWDIRFSTSDGLGSDDVTAAHEQMHAVLTEHTAWGSILKTALEEHRLHPGPGTARRLALFTDACRQTQEALATYVSLAHRVPADLAAYSRGNTSFAYRHYLDLALQLAPDLPPLSPRRTVILTAACWVAMQPAAVLPALEGGPAFPLSAVEHRHRPDARLRAIASLPPSTWGRVPNSRWTRLLRLDRPRWAGSPLAYRLGLTLGRQLADGEIRKWYAFLAARLRERTGSDTLPWDDQTVFTERLLGLYQDSGKDLGMYTEDMLGARLELRGGRFTVPTAVEKVVFAAKERIVLHGDRRTATLLPFNRVCAVPEVRARPVVAIRPSADWLSEYDWDEAGAQALRDGPADVALLQVPMPDAGVPVGAVVLGTDARPAELAELAQDRPQLLLSARYLAPALADEYWQTEDRPLRALLARLVDVADPVVVVLDIELNILVAVWAAAAKAMSVSWFPLGAGSDPAGRDLAVVVAAFADSDPLFLGVCRRDRAEELVKALTGMRSLRFTRRPAEAFTDVARARAIAEHLVLTRSYVGMSPVEETPL